MNAIARDVNSSYRAVVAEGEPVVAEQRRQILVLQLQHLVAYRQGEQRRKTGATTDIGGQRDAQGKAAPMVVGGLRSPAI